MDKMTLGDRMKCYYEDAYRIKMPRKHNIIIRVDGKAFHTFTKSFERPFDKVLMDSMVKGALETSKVMQGFKLAYVQSDEVSFWINDTNDIDTEAWFDNNLQKIVSVTAATMTLKFVSALYNRDLEIPQAVFDARAFVIPENEISNYFLWRAKDWERNSLNMYCETFFSSKQLHGKNANDRHEMLHSVGKNWTTDLTDQQRNGTFICNDSNNNIMYDVKPHYNDINVIVQKMMEHKNESN